MSIVGGLDVHRNQITFDGVDQRTGEAGRAGSRRPSGWCSALASFGYIGVIWVNHHQLFTRVAAVDLGLLWLNLGLLLCSSVLPFPTAVLSSAFRNGSRSNEVTGSILYALIAALMSFTWLVLFHYLATHERLLARETPASFFVQERRRALLGVLAYLLAAPVALWQPLASLVIICVLPVFYGATSEGWGRTRFAGAWDSMHEIACI